MRHVHFPPFLAIAASATDVLVPSHLPSRQLVRDAYGYSLEPVWTTDYISTNLTSELMNIIADITGKPPAFRVGGTTADQTYFHPDQSIAVTDTFNISSVWFQNWGDYLPDGTNFTYTLNFAVNTSDWANAVEGAAAVNQALGPKLRLFELGNEVDHYINKGWRPSSWDVTEFIQQGRNLSDQVVDSDWYRSAANPPKFQAAVFADPPEVSDQQDEIDDFDIVNLTCGG